jgi:hypothetical protein
MKSYLDDALDMVVAICNASLEPESRGAIGDEAKPMPLSLMVQGDIASYLAAAHIFLYEETGHAGNLDLARDYLKLPMPVGAFGANAFWKAVNGLREADCLSDEQDDHLYRACMSHMVGSSGHHFTRTPDFRIFNHAVTSASLADVSYRLWPDSAEAQRYADQAEEVWADWWRFGENIEGAPNYEAFAQCHILHWGARRGELERVVNDPRTLAWMDRGLDHIPAIGFVPGFGDSHSTELWSDWFGFVALIAAWSPGRDAEGLRRKGRAVWAAERIIGWYRDHDWLQMNIDLASRPEAKNKLTAHRIWWHTVWAAYYLAEGRHFILSEADDIKSVPPEIMPTITHRTLPSHDLIRNESWSLVPPKPGQRVPDKGMLRLGTKTTSPYCMFALQRQSWHDHMDVGAIDNYSVGGKVLIDDNGYAQNLPVDHNIFFAARESETWLGYEPGDWQKKRGKVASFGPVDFQPRGMTGRNVAQMIVAECRGPNEMPIYTERTALLGRTGELVIRDRVVPYADDVVGSPIWHTQYVRDSGIDDNAAWVEAEITDFRGGNGCLARQSDARFVIADPLNLDAGEWKCLDQTKPERVFTPDMDDDPRSYTELLISAHVTKNCLYRKRSMVRDTANHFVTVMYPAEMRQNGTSPCGFIDGSSHEADKLVLDVNGRLVVMNETLEMIKADWGMTDAATLWADADGVMAHRTQRIELRRAGVVEIVVESSEMPLDVDLTVDGDVVTGHISSEKPTDVRIVAGGTERRLNVYGIVGVTRYT